MAPKLGKGAYNVKMTSRVIHLSEAEAAAMSFASLLATVRAGAEIIIEDDAQPIVILRPVDPVRRSISECIALLQDDSTATVDAEFHEDVDSAVESQRDVLNPPAWD